MKRLQREIQREGAEIAQMIQVTGISRERLMDIAYSDAEPYPYELQSLSAYLKLPIHELGVEVDAANPVPTKQSEPKSTEGKTMARSKTRRTFTDEQKIEMVKTEYEHVRFKKRFGTTWFCLIPDGTWYGRIRDGYYNPGCYPHSAAELREIADFLDALNKEGA